MPLRLVGHQPGEARVFHNGMAGNPPRPVALYRCDLHGADIEHRYPWAPARCRECDAEARARVNSVRRPPPPPYRGQAGRCAFCGTTELPPRRRSWCSDACVTLWNVASGQAALHHLTQLHGRWCQACGQSAAYLEVDHWRPLWSLTPELRGELRWWLPFNLRLLCARCHRSKTRYEAALRALVRRGEAEWVQWPGPDAEPPPPRPRRGKRAAAGQLGLAL